MNPLFRIDFSISDSLKIVRKSVLIYETIIEETWFYRLDMPEGYKHFSKTKPMKLEHFQPVLNWWENRQEITEDGFDKAKKFSVQQLTEELGYNLDQCGFPHEEEEILEPMELIRRYEEQRASLNAEIDQVLEEITSLLGGAIE